MPFVHHSSSRGAIQHSERGPINSPCLHFFMDNGVNCSTKYAWVKLRSVGRPYLQPNTDDPLPDAWFILTVFPLSHSPSPLHSSRLLVSLSLSLFLSQLIEDACNYSVPAPRLFVSVMSRNIHKECDESRRKRQARVVEIQWREPEQAMQGSRSWTGLQDYTLAHSLTRSGVWEGRDRTTGQDTTNATCSAIHVLFWN
jgi:hypothetical protein